MKQETITSKHKNFCKKYNKNITYNCYYRYLIDWYTDETLKDMQFIQWNHKPTKKWTVKYQWREWLKTSWFYRWYEWYLRKIREKKPLVEDSRQSIKIEWEYYCKTNEDISYNKYYAMFYSKNTLSEPIVVWYKPIKKLKLNIDTGWDDYYSNL